VIKKTRTRGGYSPARGLQNTNPQWVVAPVEKKNSNIVYYQEVDIIVFHTIKCTGCVYFRIKEYNTSIGCV